MRINHLEIMKRLNKIGEEGYKSSLMDINQLNEYKALLTNLDKEKRSLFIMNINKRKYKLEGV